MAVSNTNDGTWQISSGTHAEVLAEIRAHAKEGADIAGFYYDVTGTTYHVLIRIKKGTE